jgi:hypothetical protein
LPHRVPFANLGLVYHQITYCMLGRQTKWIQLKIMALLIHHCVNKWRTFLPISNHSTVQTVQCWVCDLVFKVM